MAKTILRCAVVLYSVVGVVLPQSVSAEPAAGQTASLDVGQLDRLFAEASASERSGFEFDRERPSKAIAAFLHAAELFEKIAQQREEPTAVAEAYWRSARALWLAADTLPRNAKQERVGYYLRAEPLLDLSIEIDRECGECLLWKFSTLGRLATTRGIWSQGRQIPVMADLLERGIALQPTHADDENNSALGNLHYSSAIFYRVLPDWFWMSWIFGVRGDKQRSLGHIRTALELHPARLDYQVELGSQLVCLATSEGEPTQLERGRDVLGEALEREPQSLDDERELEAAQIMLDEPRKACGYSGDAWLEIDRKKAERAARR